MPTAADSQPDPPSPSPAPDADFAATLIRTRQHVGPKRLHPPGPDSARIDAYFQAAAAAPDHGQILPWRFVVIPDARRGALGEAFAAALRERDPQAAQSDLDEARGKALRAPFLALAIVREGGDGHPEIPPHERLVSLGCAIQNILLQSHADGFAAGLVSGKALESRAIRALFALTPNERAVCFLAIGTALQRKPARQRPAPERFVSRL